MEENRRELATNRLLDIIRRARFKPDAPVEEELALPDADDRPGSEADAQDLGHRPASPEHAVEFPGTIQERAATVPSPETGIKYEPGQELPDDILSASEPEPALQPEVQYETALDEGEIDIDFPDYLMPLHQRLARKLKPYLERVKDKLKNALPKKKPSVPEVAEVIEEEEPPKARVKIKGKRVFALDIGSATVKMVGLVKRGSGCQLLEAGIRTIPLTLRSGQAGQKPFISKAIRELLPGDRLKNARLHLLLRDRSIQVKRLDLPEASPKERINAIKFQINKDLPFPLDSCEIAYRGWNPKVKGRQEVEVLAIHKRELDRVLELLDEIALTPSYVTAFPTALRSLLDGYEGFVPEKGAVAIVDIGGSKTTITVIENNSVLLCRTVTTGGDDFSTVLTGLSLSPDGEELDEESAEKYKMEIGLPPDGDPETTRVAMFMKPVAERISSEIARSIEFLRSQKAQSELQKVILIGGGALMKRLPEFLSENLGIDVEVGDPLARVEISHAITEESQRIITEFGPAFIPALAVGLDNGVEQNVLPAEMKAAEKINKLKGIIPLIAAALLAAMIGLYTIALTDLRTTKIEHKDIESKLTGLTKYRTLYLAAKSKLDKLQTEMYGRKEDYTNIAEGTEDIPEYMQLLSNVVPNHIYLDKLQTRYVNREGAFKEEYDPDDPDGTGKKEELEEETVIPTYDMIIAELSGKNEEEQLEMMRRPIYGKVLVMEGIIYPLGALTDMQLVNFIYSLENSGWFRDVAVEEINRAQTGKIQFKIVCGI